MSMIASNAPGVNLSVGLIKFPAALLIKQSIDLKCLKPVSITFFTSSWFLTSPAIAIVLLFEILLNSSAVLSMTFCLLLVIIILAPNFFHQ